MRCMWCGRDVTPERQILGYGCPKCGHSMDGQIRRMREWAKVEAAYQKAREKKDVKE